MLLSINQQFHKLLFGLVDSNKRRNSDFSVSQNLLFGSANTNRSTTGPDWLFLVIENWPLNPALRFPQSFLVRLSWSSSWWWQSPRASSLFCFYLDSTLEIWIWNWDQLFSVPKVHMWLWKSIMSPGQRTATRTQRAAQLSVTQWLLSR